jgi:hypothetical protein
MSISKFDDYEIMPPPNGALQTQNDALQLGVRKWELPPLILHPFSDQSGPGKLLDSSRASLMLNGLLPNDNNDQDELARRLIEGRLCEIRMLFFVGKDVMRWMSQCVEFIASVDELKGLGISEHSFSDLLIQNPPQQVKEKLKLWGVHDYRSIFSRAIALNAVFAHPPEPAQVSEEFVRNYYRFADHLFACRQQMIPFREVKADNFYFEIYASGEYSRLLEKVWERE